MPKQLRALELRRCVYPSPELHWLQIRKRGGEACSVGGNTCAERRVRQKRKHIVHHIVAQRSSVESCVVKGSDGAEIVWQCQRSEQCRNAATVRLGIIC